jgi:glycosyltransferase involved in cell wall biosynthesis
MSSVLLPDHVHVDASWIAGGIGRFSSNVLPLVRGNGRELVSRLDKARPSGQIEMAARFTPLGARGGIFLSPGFAPPFGWERRSIVTVHDLHFLDRATASPLRYWYFRAAVLRQLRRCRLVLTVSQNSATQVQAALGRNGPQVVVVGNGVDAALLAVQPDRTAPNPQLLFVGGDKTNKNLPMALRAFKLAQHSTGAELLVVGKVSDETRHLAPPGVRFVGTVSEPQLADLYGQSTALLMPSIAEGFGLPALEAMAAGTPVIYGNRDALPEVVGDLGWPVDPFDDRSVAAGIEAAVREPIDITEHQRQKLVERHRWADVADRVRSAVEGVL